MAQLNDISLDRIPVGTMQTMGCTTPVYADLTQHSWSLSMNFNMQVGLTQKTTWDTSMPGPEPMNLIQRANFQQSGLDIGIQIPDVNMGDPLPDDPTGHPGCFLVDDVTLAPSGDFRYDVNGTAQGSIHIDATRPDSNPDHIMKGRMDTDFNISGNITIESLGKSHQPSQNSGVEREPITISADISIKDVKAKAEIEQAPREIPESRQPSRVSNPETHMSAGQTPPEMPEEVATLRKAMDYTLQDGAPPMPPEISALRTNMEKIMDHAAATGQTHMSVSEAIIRMNPDLALDGTDSQAGTEALYAPEIFEQVLGIDPGTELDLSDPENRGALADVASFTQHSVNDILTMYSEQRQAIDRQAGPASDPIRDNSGQNMRTAPEPEAGLG